MATTASSQSKVLSKLDKIGKNYVKIAKKWSSVGYIYLFPKKYILIYDVSYNPFNNTNLTFWQAFFSLQNAAILSLSTSRFVTKIRPSAVFR